METNINFEVQEKNEEKIFTLIACSKLSTNHMKLTYITNIKLSESSGGMSGINHAVYHQLKRFFDIEDYIYINAKEDKWAKVKSKLLRSVGFKGNYPFFSDKRLNAINTIFQDHKESCDAYFFFGFTSWIDTAPSKPYYCYNDACFATYVDIYNNKSEFSVKDLERIYQKEQLWLKQAKGVFFNSDWALELTKEAYGLEGRNFINMGFGGFIDVPKHDIYQSGYHFLFISREFIPKGGKVVAEAINIIRKTYSEAKVWVVGDQPPKDLQYQEGLEYKGFFSKSNPKEKQQLTTIFSQAFALVHPTLKDTTTLVITESAYFGCPAIASNRFAIPEFVEEKETGLLLDEPRDAHELAAKMLWLIEHPEAYQSMRQKARTKALKENTWDQVGARFQQYIQP
jgi:glycosyltransferase involved in cell wall biosynthesis